MAENTKRRDAAGLEQVIQRPSGAARVGRIVHARSDILGAVSNAAWLMRLLGTLICVTLWSGAARADQPYVLVHGSWVGAWYWQPIVDGLQAAGYDAYAVSFRGDADSAVPGGPEVRIEDYITDIGAVLTDNDLHDVILVAHSFGGKPATGAWDRWRDRIAKVVYVEAVAPLDDSPIAIPGDSRSLAFIVISLPDAADTGMLAPSPTLRESPGKPLAPMPLAALYGAVTLEKGPLPPTPGTFVIGTRSRAPIFRQYAERLHDRRGWNVVELDAGHDVVVDAGVALTDLLLGLQN